LTDLPETTDTPSDFKDSKAMISEFVHAPSPPPHADCLVCVVDDDESDRRELEQLLRSAQMPVETYASAGDYLGRKEHPGPVCLVLDAPMPGLDGFELQQALAERHEKIVFLTSHGDVPMCVQAMKSGAVDFLIKPVDDEVFLSAVAVALVRSREITAAKAEREAARAIFHSLTPRELQVMEQVVAGRLNKQIASVLGIAEKTVKIHRGRVMSKTRSASVPDLMRLMLKANA
jgi:two-component system response regulator FixJ